MKVFLSPSAFCRAVVLTAGLLWAVGINAGEPPKKIRIIYTTDTLGWLEPCG